MLCVTQTVENSRVLYSHNEDPFRRENLYKCKFLADQDFNWSYLQKKKTSKTFFNTLELSPLMCTTTSFSIPLYLSEGMERVQKRALKSPNRFQLKGRFKDLELPNFVRPRRVRVNLYASKLLSKARNWPSALLRNVQNVRIWWEKKELVL